MRRPIPPLPGLLLAGLWSLPLLPGEKAARWRHALPRMPVQSSANSNRGPGPAGRSALVLSRRTGPDGPTALQTQTGGHRRRHPQAAFRRLLSLSTVGLWVPKAGTMWAVKGYPFWFTSAVLAHEHAHAWQQETHKPTHARTPAQTCSAISQLHDQLAEQSSTVPPSRASSALLTQWQHKVAETRLSWSGEDFIPDRAFPASGPQP